MKLHIFIILFLFTQSLFAQEDARNYNYIAGGTMNFLYQKNAYPLSSIAIYSSIGGIYSGNTDDLSNLSFTIQPYIGKVLSRNWILGLQTDYRMGRYRVENLSSSLADGLWRNANQIGGGLFARYTFNPAQKFNFYLQPSALFQHLYEKSQYDFQPIQKARVNYFALNSNLGMLYAINEQFNINLRMGVLSFVAGYWERKDIGTSNNFASFNTNLRFSNLSFGMEFKF